MDNNIVPDNEDNTGESNSSDINVNNDIGGSNRRITEESSINEPLEITSIPQDTTEQASELPLSNIINATASRMTSGIFPITSTSDTDINEYQESISRSQLSDSELFMNLEDVVTTSDNRSLRKHRLSAPTPFRPKEYSDPIKPRPNSQIILPTSMQHYDPFAMPSSDQEFRMLARILNWPVQPGQGPVAQISGHVGSSSIKDNMVDGGEIIFDTSIDREGDIQQSKGQHPYKTQSTFHVPHGFSVTDAMRQMTKPLQTPEVPPLISTNYGKEIFDQIKSDDDPRLIVWSKSRAQEIKHDSTFSISSNNSKRWNYTFLTDFFLTYRKFITPIKLCKLLILRFDWALDDDDAERRIVRVRTFVTIRHWLLNYFAYDFIPCRALRTTLTKYLNSLPSHQVIKKSPRDQRIVQGLKRVIRRLKRVYFRKNDMNSVKKKDYIFSIGTKQLGGKDNEKLTVTSFHKKKNQDLDVDKMMVDSGGGSGVGTSLIEESANLTVSYDSSNYYSVTQKQSNLLRHQSSSSSLDSTITPGTTDSESEAIDYYTPNISGVTRKETHQNIIYSSSSNSHTSDEDLSSKATHDQIDELYGQKWSKNLPKNLPTSFSELVPIDLLRYSERKADKWKKRSNSMGDLSQRRLDIFNQLGGVINENENPLSEEEPPPLPPRRRRHTLDVSSASLSFFKSGFLKNNFPLKKPKKAIPQEKIVDYSLPNSRGITRRNSSPAFIGSHSSRTGNQPPVQEQNWRRPAARPSWPRKMSITVGKFAKGLFNGEKNKGATQSGISTKCGGIQGDFRTMKFGRLSMLCATSSGSASTEDVDSDLSWGDGTSPKHFNGDEYHYHVDGFSYVDESVEEEYHDTSHPEESEIIEQQFDQWYDEQQSTQDDTNFESLTSSPIDSHPPTFSTFSQDKQSDDDDILQQDYEEPRDNRQLSRTTRRRGKVWNYLVPVIEVEDDIDQPTQSSETDTYFVSQSSSNGSQKDDDQQPARKQSYLASVSEVEEDDDTDPNFSPQQSFEQEYDDLYEEESGDHHNIRTLRRLPKVPDLRSVTNLKDLDEKSSKRVSWGTFSSYGVEGGGATADSVPDSLASLSRSTSKTAPTSRRRGPAKNGSQESGARQRTRHTVSRPLKNSAEAIALEKGTNNNRGGNASRSKRPKHTPIHTTTEPSVSQGPTSSFSSTVPSSRQHPYKSFIMSYRSEAIAKQFCLLERDLLMQVQWEELVQVSWTNGNKNTNNNDNDVEKDSNTQDIRKEAKKDVKGKNKEFESEIDEENIKVKPIKDGGVDKVIERFNQTIDWVATEIMLTHSLEDRVRVIEKFIRIAQ
ncbi:10598_t:CDS:2, partial [Cetraspora pellucida]